MAQSIRTATPEDLDAIVEMEADCYLPTEVASREEVQDRLREYPNHFWLKFDDGVLVSGVNGFCSYSRDLTDDMYEDASLHDETGEWQMVFSVATHVDHRKQGHAADLLKRLIEQARDENRTGLVLACKDFMVPYYAKFGFVNEGESGSSHGGVMWNQMRLTFAVEPVTGTSDDVA